MQNGLKFQECQAWVLLSSMSISESNMLYSNNFRATQAGLADFTLMKKNVNENEWM